MKMIGEGDGNVRGGVTNPIMIIPGEDECNSSSSSSIGDDSDANGEDVESGYGYEYDRQNDNTFDDAIQALEQALPIRRGIFTFYNGKSKSFTSLAGVWPTSSVQDIAKPETLTQENKRILELLNYQA